MESLGVPLGPYRATKLEYLSGRKHRQRLKKYGNCFTAGEASQSYKVTRQQTIQLLRIFLKNHVIEDIKGRWGSENVDDNNQLFRFPAISPLKTLPRRTPKKHGIHLSQENAKKIKHEIINEDQENAVGNRELSQEDVEEISRYVVLIYLQTILGVPSLEEVINPKQVIPQYIMYNMANTSKHDWPRTDDMNNSTYVGFKQVVFRTITDYFLDLPEPLLTFEYYKLSVNILVICGYVIVSDRSSGIHRIQDDPHTFFSVYFIEKKEESDYSERLQISNPGFQERCAKKMQLVNLRNRRVSANDIMGGSCHNLIGLSGMHDLSSNSKPSCCSLEGIVDVSGNSSKEASSVFHLSFPNIEGQNNKLFLESKPKEEFLLNLHSEKNTQKPFCADFKRTTTLTAQDQENLCNGKCKSKWLCSTRRNSYINTPVAEIMKPNVGQGSTSVQTAMESELRESSATINKRLCKSSIEFSENSLLPASSSFLQPQLERVAIDAVQLCCLLLPPPNCRKLQLLMHMISQMSQNVDMRKLHDALGTISLRIHTFSWCVLCCAEEVDLDELLAGRLVSFLTGHHQEILQTAAEKHLDYLRKGHIESPGDGLFVSLPTYSYYKQISARDFDEQKVSTSQAAIAELLGNIIKNKSLPLEEKRKKLKQFQNEYPLIYQERFPTTESETALFGDEPTIKQPMLILRKPKFHSLRY
uniref:DEP domain-containing protein n=1 Tax=Colobus angolensis palliatus TaxID=336983 RepID=A0A2K5J870_COLAP